MGVGSRCGHRRYERSDGVVANPVVVLVARADAGIVPGIDGGVVAALAGPREPQISRSGIGELWATVEGVARSLVRFRMWIAEVRIPGLREASYAGRRVTAARIADGPTHGLVGVEPGVGAVTDGRATEGHDRCAKISQVIGADGPGELKRVEGAPAGDGVIPSACA